MAKRIPVFKPHNAPDARKVYSQGDARKEDNRFYSSTKWRKLRALFLAHHPLCEDCQREGRVTAAQAVHHVIERKADPSKALDYSNLESCCPEHHNAKRRKVGNDQDQD